MPNKVPAANKPDVKVRLKHSFSLTKQIGGRGQLLQPIYSSYDISIVIFSKVQKTT
jgi:hypothetical protein